MAPPHQNRNDNDHDNDMSEEKLLSLSLGWMNAGLLALNGIAVARYTNSTWAGVASASGLAVLVISVHVHWRALSAAIANRGTS